MLNSAEAISYWYLRLNGYFLIDNFVIHKSATIDHTSDADLLGLRMPFVFEEIGGQNEDWDDFLLNKFEDDSLVGIICQVKGGAIGQKKLFREPYLTYNLRRFGLTEDISEIRKQLDSSPIATIQNEIGQKCQVAKLLITRDEPAGKVNYFWKSLKEVYDFIEDRIQKYPKEKYNDRNFFSSIGFQTIIEMNELKKEK